jgi:hypothetical protein
MITMILLLKRVKKNLDWYILRIMTSSMFAGIN